MKHIIVFTLLTFGFFISLKSQTVTRLYKVEYYYTSAYEECRYDHYKITLNPDSTGRILYTISHDLKPGDALIYEFTFTGKDFDSLNQIIHEYNILESITGSKVDSIPVMLKPTEIARITYSKFIDNDSITAPVKLKTVTTPLYPTEELKKGLEKFYNKVNSFIPFEIKEKINKRGGKYLR